MRKLLRRAASIALAAAMLFTTAGVSQKKIEAASCLLYTSDAADEL